ncbi:hypothetical protein DPM13_07125 [Paracoccus mutanolyticus]|uniref:Uncharacterized protein n=1 Tax=Paracoccus mutanolyticus TaxID=1499308 RepID=A0ABM6WQX0_9RHOB|nr:hypothetical protein [Paracoccus mutanolyticus]AWX92992.1 hypothetical protein DPM13_07125 [Paracoccus mutanolyticus]
MIWPLLLTAAVAGTPAPASADALIAQATEAMLASEAMPADMEARMMTAIGRRACASGVPARSGLFSGPEWPIDRVLAPAGQEKAP